MLHGFNSDPHFFTSATLPANILLSYVNTTKFPEHCFRFSLFCFLYPDVYHFAILFFLLSHFLFRIPPVMFIVPLIHLPVHNPPVPQPTPTAHIQHKVFRSRTMNYWTLISFLCLSYLSLLTLPYPVHSYYQDCALLLTASNWTALWQVRYFYPPTKFCLSLPLSEIYFAIQILSKILSYIHCFKFTSQYHFNGRVQRSFTENRAEIQDTS